MTTPLLFIGGLGMPEVIFIAFLVLLLFGGKKIPELMKGLGRGVRSFKDGMNGIEEKDETAPGKREETATDAADTRDKA